MFKFDLCSKVKDKLTDVSGIVMCRTEYALSGIRTYGIMPVELKDDRIMEWTWLPEERLEDPSFKKLGFLH